MSTIVTDTITGKSTATTITIGSTPVVSASANSMTIRGEGSNQTSIQQGLAKAWCRWESSGTASVEDSFNNSSLTDNGTGDYSWTYTNNFNNAGYAQPLGARSDNGECPAYYGSPTSSGNRSFIFLISNVSSASDNPNFTMSSHGDLA